MTTLVFDVLFGAEAAELEAKIAKAQAELDKLNAQKVSPKIDLDIDKAAAQVAQIKARLDDLSAKISTPKVDADILAAKANLAIVQAKLDELNRQKISSTIDVDIAAAEAKLAALKAELDSISNEHVEVNVDTDKGSANVRKLGSEVDGLIAKVAGIGPNFFSMGGAITTALIPAIQDVGALSGALGLIPAMAAGAGTAFAAVAIGVQGVDTAFKASEKSIKANEAAVKADAAAQQAHTTAVQAGTSTGQANIAVLQQAVTQGAAHVASLNAQKLAGQNVTAELKAAQAAQAGNVAALKTAQAAYSGNTAATGTYTAAQKNASTAASAAAAAHKAAAKAADEQAASMKNLAPAAQQFVSQMIQIKPAFDALHMDVQQALFKGLGDQLKQIAETVLPVVKTGLTQMAAAVNEVVTKVTEFLTKQTSVKDWAAIFTNLADTVRQFAGAIQPILQTFTDLTAVGSSMLPGLARGFADAMQSAADFVSKARETGQLQSWIQTGIEAVKKLWGIFSDLVQIIAKVTAAPGPGLLDMVKGILDVVLALVDKMPWLITLVEGFIAAWVTAKVITGITSMISKIKEAGTAIGILKEAQLGKAASGEAMAAGEVAAGAGVGKMTGFLKVATIAVGAYVVGQALLAVGNDNTGRSFKNMAQDGADFAGKLLTLDIPGVMAKISRAWTSFPDDVEKAKPRLNAAWQGVTAVMNAGGGAVSAEAAKVSKAIGDAFTPLPAIVTGSVGGLNVVVNEGVHQIVAAIGTLPPLTQAQLGQLAPAMRAPTEAALAGLFPIVTSGMQNITNQVQGLSPQVQAALAPLSPAMQQSMQSAMGGMLPIVSSGIVNVSAAVGQLPPQVQTSLSPLQAALQEPATAGFAGMLQVVQQGAQSITSQTGQLPGQVQGSVGDMSNTLQPAGSSAMTGFYNSMINFYNGTIVPWLQSIAQSIANLKGPVSHDRTILLENGRAIMEGLHTGLKGRWAGIETWLRGCTDQISSIVGGGTSGGGTVGDNSGSALASIADPLTARSTSMFQAAGGTASLTSLRAFHRIAPPPAFVAPPAGSGGSSGSKPPVIHIHPGGGGIDRMFIEWLRNAIRGMGGDVQLVLGQ